MGEDRTSTKFMVWVQLLLLLMMSSLVMAEDSIQTGEEDFPDSDSTRTDADVDSPGQDDPSTPIEAMKRSMSLGRLSFRPGKRWLSPALAGAFAHDPSNGRYELILMDDHQKQLEAPIGTQNGHPKNVFQSPKVVSHIQFSLAQPPVEMEQQSMESVGDIQESDMGKRSVASGRLGFRPAKRSMAVGRTGFRPGKRSLAVGRSGFRPGKRSLAVGRSGFRPGKRSLAVGRSGFRPGKRSLAVGRSGFRPGKRSLAVGRSGFRPGKRSLAVGRSGFRPGKRTSANDYYLMLGDAGQSLLL